MSKIGLTNEELQKIQTILDFLFFDQYTHFVSFPRFEQCFLPLFSKSFSSELLFTIFKEISGPKKKYITCERFLKSYLSYKKNDTSKELKSFYDILFSQILKDESNFVGKPTKDTYNYSTIKSCKNREFISNIQILTDKNNEIKGINIVYDDVFENNMFPSSLENDLDISLDMNLGLIDEKPIKMKRVGKFFGLKEKIYRDSITHIFGNFDNNKNELNLLGFKCLSGKTVFVGKNNSENNGFLFGNFGKKFHLIKLQLSENGINLLNPIFETNSRTNFFIKKKFENIDENDLIRDDVFLDEKLMLKMTNEEELNKFINAPLLEDNYFFDKKLEDEISGSDYKEIINKTPMKWLVKDNIKDNNKKIEKINNIDEALKKFEVEKQRQKNIDINNNINDDKDNIKNLKGKRNLRGRKKFGKRMKFRKYKYKDDELNYNNKIKKWNGDLDNIKFVSPNIFYKRKDNYILLKNELARSIQKELLESEDNNMTHNHEALLEQIFPEMAEIQGKNNKNTKPSLKKKKLLKKQILIKKSSSTGEDIPFSSNQINNEENNLIYSDAIQIFSDLENKKDNNNIYDFDNLFNFGQTEKYFPTNEEFIPPNLRAKGYTYAPLNTNITHIKNNYYYESNSKLPGKRYQKGEYDPIKTRAAQNNWKKFNTQLKKVNGIYILQTIGAIIKAMHILEQYAKGKKYLFVSEKIKLLKLLEDNEVIIDFLTKKNLKEESDEDEEEDTLIPDEHPEKITNISQLEQNIKDIEKLLENKKLKEDQKNKLEKLKNLYLQQKNILIENENNKIKKEIIDKNKIDIDKIIKEEEQRRKLIEKENEKLIEQMEQKNKIEEEKKSKEKEKTNKIIKEENTKELTIYKNQQIIPENAPAWTDPLFKPERQSLCPYDSQGWIFPEKVTKLDVQGWKNYIWLRPEDIYDSKNYDIFHEGATVDDIIQGSLGDCYFLSVLGSLCEYPKLIEKLFYSKNLSKKENHQYGINFYINGKWKLILLDDYFPSRNTSFKKFAFAYSSTKEIWVPLLEKAWAKINGCYAKVGTGGLPNEVFDLCSEAYNEYILIKNKNKDLLWKEIFEGEKKNYMMTAGTTKNTNNFRLEKIGLTPGHAYTVLGVLEINKEQVVKLRNPWGNFEFSGDWSDYSPKWTEELKKKYEFNKKNDGVFYMGFNDFLKYFITIGFAKIHPDYISNDIKIKKEQNIKCQLIKIRSDNTSKQSVHAFIQLYQKNPRIILKDGTYQNTALSFLILVDNDFNYLVSTSSNKMHIGIEYNLEPNKDYYIFSDLNYRYDPDNKGINHGYRITSYSECNITFENLTENNNYNVPSLLRKSMIDYVKKNVRKSKYNGMTIYTTASYSDYFPFTIAYFENEKNVDNLIKLNINYRGDKGFCFYCDDIADEDDTKIEKELPGNGNNIVLIMKYTLSSIFSLNYIFITDKRSQEEKEIYQNKIKANNSSKASENNLNNNQPKKVKTNISNNSSSIDVFKEEGEPIKPNSDLIQYIKEIKNGYILGLENKGKKKLRCKLNTEGLTLTDTMYKGRGSPTFYLDPGEKKVFNANINKDYKGDLSFQFLSY